MTPKYFVNNAMPWSSPGLDPPHLTPLIITPYSSLSPISSLKKYNADVKSNLVILTWLKSFQRSRGLWKSQNVRARLHFPENGEPSWSIMCSLTSDAIIINCKLTT